MMQNMDSFFINKKDPKGHCTKYEAQKTQQLHHTPLMYLPVFIFPCCSISDSIESVTDEPHLIHCGNNFIMIL
jgi:hypothetical protein